MYLIFLCLMLPSLLFSMETENSIVENEENHSQEKNPADSVKSEFEILSLDFNALAEFNTLIESEDFHQIKDLIKKFREITNKSPRFFEPLKNYKNENYRQALSKAFEINFGYLYKLPEYSNIFKSKFTL